MSNKLTTHLFTKILEIRGHNPVSKSAAREALQALETEFKSISLAEGAETAENLLSYKTVKRALEQCLAYHQNSNPTLTYEDNLINYEYAYWKLQQYENSPEKV
ncbi:hypothetical protein [Thiopseudomonas alkaliphila]|uniref:hypothetical protein n=1 Tax=Thiopseudomonas alkaliphila TaxID=1697053 RepID=UPI0011DE52CF|nr:hypothetical protein [Thiopseudomonas alkaliphila]